MTDDFKNYCVLDSFPVIYCCLRNCPKVSDLEFLFYQRYPTPACVDAEENCPGKG